MLHKRKEEVKITQPKYRTVRWRTCDICKPQYKTKIKCKYCNKDVCKRCSRQLYDDPLMNSDYDDEDVQYCRICKTCYTKSQPFIKQIKTIVDVAETQIKKIKTECLKCCNE